MQSNHWDTVGHWSGLAIWGAGCVALLGNVWLMRSTGALALLWGIGAGVVAVGSLLAGYFGAKRNPGEKLAIYRAATLVASAAALAAFLYLAAVMPSASESGKRATAFFAALAADDLDRAYEMLSEEAQAKISRDEFPKQLPPNYLAQTGSSVMGIENNFGTIVGDPACVDGFLKVPEGMPIRFALGLSEEDGVMKIRTLSRHGCESP